MSSPLDPSGLPTREPKATPVRVHIHTTLSPAEAMALTVLTPLPEIFDKWAIFPGVTRTETVAGTWPELDATRWIIQTNKRRMLERVARFESGKHYTYVLSDWTESWDTMWDLVEDNWVFEPDGNGGTIVHWTWFIHVVKSKPLFHSVFRPIWKLNMTRMLTRLLRAGERYA